MQAIIKTIFTPAPLLVLLFTLLLTSLSACTPNVSVEVPDKPLTINLNVKVEHEIHVRVDKELESLFESEDELF